MLKKMLMGALISSLAALGAGCGALEETPTAKPIDLATDPAVQEALRAYERGEPLSSKQKRIIEDLEEVKMQQEKQQQK